MIDETDAMLHKKDSKRKGRRGMLVSRQRVATVLLACLLLGQRVMFGRDPESVSSEEQEYEHDHNRLVLLITSLSQSRTADLEAYERFADDIDKRWRTRNRVDHARLMLDVCRPLSSGAFGDSRRYELAREHALSALDDSDSIPLAFELELIGHVTTVTIGPGAVEGESFAERRRRDTSVRLHAWKRLIDAVDPDWDPEDLPRSSVAPPAVTGLPSGVDPRAIEDGDLRKEYEAAIQRNREKAERYKEQYELRKWLRTFPRRVESDIAQAYSHPPFDTGELRALLHDHPIDPEADVRILNAVERSTGERQKD